MVNISESWKKMLNLMETTLHRGAFIHISTFSPFSSKSLHQFCLFNELQQAPHSTSNISELIQSPSWNTRLPLTPAPRVGSKGRVISKQTDWWNWHTHNMKYSRTAKSRVSVPGYRKKDKGGHSLASLIVWPQLVVQTAAQTVSERGTLLEQAAGRQWGRGGHSHQGESHGLTGWSGGLWMGSPESVKSYWLHLLHFLFHTSSGQLQIDFFPPSPLIHHSVDLWTTPNWSSIGIT